MLLDIVLSVLYIIDYAETALKVMALITFIEVCTAQSENLTLTFGLMNNQVPERVKYKYLYNRSTFYAPGGIETASLLESHLLKLQPKVHISFKFYDAMINHTFSAHSNTLYGNMISGKLEISGFLQNVLKASCELSSSGDIDTQFSARWVLNSGSFDHGIRYSTPFMHRQTCFVTSQTNDTIAGLSGNAFYFVLPFASNVWSVGQSIMIIEHLTDYLILEKLSALCHAFRCYLQYCCYFILLFDPQKAYLLSKSKSQVFLLCFDLVFCCNLQCKYEINVLF